MHAACRHARSLVRGRVRARSLARGRMRGCVRTRHARACARACACPTHMCTRVCRAARTRARGQASVHRVIRGYTWTSGVTRTLSPGGRRGAPRTRSSSARRSRPTRQQRAPPRPPHARPLAAAQPHRSTQNPATRFLLGPKGLYPYQPIFQLVGSMPGHTAMAEMFIRVPGDQLVPGLWRLRVSTRAASARARQGRN